MPHNFEWHCSQTTARQILEIGHCSKHKVTTVSVSRTHRCDQRKASNSPLTTTTGLRSASFRGKGKFCQSLRTKRRSVLLISPKKIQFLHCEIDTRTPAASHRWLPVHAPHCGSVPDLNWSPSTSQRSELLPPNYEVNVQTCVTSATKRLIYLALCGWLFK